MLSVFEVGSINPCETFRSRGVSTRRGDRYEAGNGRRPNLYNSALWCVQYSMEGQVVFREADRDSPPLGGGLTDSSRGAKAANAV